MPEFAVGSNVWRPSDRVPMTWETDYAAASKRPSAEALARTAALPAAGGRAGATASELAKEGHLVLGYDASRAESNSRATFVRHPQAAYDHPAAPIDPAAAPGGAAAAAAARTLAVVNPKTGAVERVPKPASAVDFGHAYPEAQSLHRQDFHAHPLAAGAEAVEALARRVEVNLATARHKHPLGYHPRELQTTARDAAERALVADPAKAKWHREAKPRDDPGFTTADAFAKKTHVTLGYAPKSFETENRVHYARHAQEHYDHPVAGVDPSASATDQTLTAVTTVTGAVREVRRVQSAVDFGHDEPHCVSITMGLQHTAAPKLVKSLGVPHALTSYHIAPYVPTYGRVKFSANEGHPALARQRELAAAAAAAAAETAFDEALLGATMYDNRDVAFKVRRAGQLPTSHQVVERVKAVVADFGGQTLTTSQRRVVESTMRRA